MPEDPEKKGLPFRRFRIRRGLDPIGDLGALRELYHIFRELEPLAVHAFQGKLCVWGRLAARWAGVPIVIGTIEGLGSTFAVDRPSRRIIRRVYECLLRISSWHSDLTIFQNHSDRSMLVNCGIVAPDTTTIIPGLGVRPELFNPGDFDTSSRTRIRKELGLDPASCVVTTLTRLTRTKGILEFARAAQTLRDSHPQARFLLVGGVDEGAMDAISASEMEFLRQWVVCAGHRVDVSAILAASDIFVFAPYQEGMPRAVLEAMSMALPVVATDIAGCNEAIEHGDSGLLVPKQDVPSLRQAVLRLIENEGLRRHLGKRARERVIHSFSLEKIVGQTRACYRSLIVAERKPDRKQQATARSSKGQAEINR